MDGTDQLGIVPFQHEKKKIDIAVQTDQAIAIRRKLDLDKSLSTPPAELRKQIYRLQDELSEANEFHSLELQILKEDYELGIADVITGEKNLNSLEKSLKDAEQIILEANKNISNLKTINEDLCKKLELESSKQEVLRAEHEDEISKLQISLKKKDVEIENLKKDKYDFDFRLELIHENYNRRICELKSVLDKENETKKSQSFDELQHRLNEENEKTKELSKKLEDLNVELLLNKEKMKVLEEQVKENCNQGYSNLLRDISLQTESIIQESVETVLQVCEKRLGAQHEISVDEFNIKLLFKDEETSENKENKELVDVSVQTHEDREMEEIRTSFEKEIKELKDEHNTKLRSLENSCENLHESNLLLTDKLNAANKIIEELKEKLIVSVENSDDLRRQFEEIKLSETKKVNNSTQCDNPENPDTELDNRIQKLQSEKEIFMQNLTNLSEEFESAKEELEALKQNYEKEIQNNNRDWELRLEEEKLGKEALNNIISEKDERLNTLITELEVAKNKAEESDNNLKAYMKDTEVCIDLLTSEKEELRKWIKRKEEEMNNLNVIVEKELIKLKTDSETKIEEMKKMYEAEINNLKNENDALCDQIESIRNMYEAEVLHFVNLLDSEKLRNQGKETAVVGPNDTDTALENCISKIKLERDSIVEMFNSRLSETSITENVKSEDISAASTIIQQPNGEEILSLVPVRPKGKYSDETIGSYNLHTMDEENMQLKINSETTMLDFVNEFAKEMVREKIINPDELKTCTNIFYSLFNKYLILLEMYSRLKEEFEEYKISEEKERFDIVNRTVRYLDTLCSQLEVSGSSHNLSNSSFMSFHEGLPSSTIMEDDYTEMEITAVNNVTMSKDPLSLSQDITLKTPMKTPLKSSKKGSQFPFKTPLRSVTKSVKTPLRPESVKKPILRTPASARPEKFASETQLVQLKQNIARKDKELGELKDLYSVKILSAENVIHDTQKNLSLLEKRIANLEALSGDLQTERENLMKESGELKESLMKTTSEMADIREKLIVEIISLNRDLEGSFSAVPAADLLSIFIHTIMESCKKMPEELSNKLTSDMEALTEKNEMYERKIFESEKEVNLLKEINATLTEEKEMIEKAMTEQSAEMKNLRQEASEVKTLKSRMQDLEERLAENDSVLQTEIYLKENTLKDLQKFKMFFEDVEKENSCLKEKIEQSDKVIHDLRAELTLAKKEQRNNEMKGDQLQKEIEQLKSILSDAEGKNKDLQNAIDNFEEEITSVNNKMQYKACQLELLSNKIANAENVIVERDQIIQELKEKITEVEGKLDELSDVGIKYKNPQMEIERLRQSAACCKESVDEEEELGAAETDLSAKMEVIQELSMKLEVAVNNARVQEETITILKERIGELENDKEQLKGLESELKNREEAKKIMAEEIEQLKTAAASSETDLANKAEDIERLSSELGKAEELRLRNEATISRMKERLEELQDCKEKLESLESELEKYREVERVMTEETELVKEKLLLSETEVKDKTEKLTEMMDLIERTKDREEALKVQVQEMLETEKNMAEKIEDLNSRLATSETEKTELIEKIEEEKEVNDGIISTLQKEVEELKIGNQQLQSLHEIVEKYKESEKVKVKELEAINQKLSKVESDLAVKTELVETMSNQLNEAEKTKMANEDTIAGLTREVESLKSDIFNFETVQNLLEVARTERNEKEMVIEDLNTKLNEFTASEKLLTAEIDSLRVRLIDTENTVKCQQEKLSQLGEVEQDLVTSKNALQEMEAENRRLKQIEDELVKVRADLESRNHQLETLTGELTRQVKSFEVLYEMNCKEIQMLREELSCSVEAFNSNKTEMETLEKGLREIEVNMEEAVAKLKADGVDPVSDPDKRKTSIEKVNGLILLYSQEVERLKQELKISKEANHNLQTEIVKLNEKCSVEIKCRSEKVETSVQLKTPQTTRKNRTGDSPSFISRRLEKLENLNDLLTGTLQKIIRALDIPFEDNLFSVGHYATSEAQIMKYISTLSLAQKGEDKSQTEELEELTKEVKQLRNAVSSVVRHVGLPNGCVNGQLIVDQIDKMAADLKRDFLERIDVLRQDNQNLDDDNNLLQTEMKKLVEQNKQNKTRLNTLANSEELLKSEVEALKGQIAKLQAKSRINRKSDICNRKLDKLEELLQSVIDLLIKMLTLTGMENVTKLNLLTMRQFEIESKKVWDYFSGWIASKTKEVEELKSQIKELDEECESYSKVIIEARQETERNWEESRAEIKNLEAQIVELKEENKGLQYEKESFMKIVKVGGTIKNCLGTGAGGKEAEELKKQNTALRSQVKDLEDSLSQARKQVEELDEECESYAKVIKETQRESLLCEETKNEIIALKEEVEKLEREKEALHEKIRMLESSNNGGKKEGKELKELKRTVAMREMKILELEQLNEKSIIHKSQIKYLENSVAVLKDQLAQEESKNQKLQREIEELSLRTQKMKPSEDLDLLDQLRVRDSIGIAAIHQVDDKEKLQKLEKDNKMLKEICRSRYNEIKRLETENQNLRGHERTTKNSNQMDSPIRTRCYNTRFRKY